MINKQITEDSFDIAEYCLQTRLILSRFHTRHFTQGSIFAGVCFIPEEAFKNYCQDTIGYGQLHEYINGGQWVIPAQYLEFMYSYWSNNLSDCQLNHLIEEILCFAPSGNLKLCLRMGTQEEVKPIIPISTSPGVNSNWVAGGFTQRRVPEIIIATASTSKYHVFDVNDKCSKEEFRSIIDAIKEIICV